jgi:hypothetical protein
MVNKLISDQSPMKSFTIPSNKSTSVSSINRETFGASKASSIISTAATAGTGRHSSLSDLDKDLQDFDIDPEKNDVSNTENGSKVLKETFKKSTDENEVKR